MTDLENAQKFEKKWIILRVTLSIIPHYGTVECFDGIMLSDSFTEIERFIFQSSVLKTGFMSYM